MLGELIYEATGKVTGMRVIDVENGLPKVETAISQNANLRGREASLIVTYVSVPSEKFPDSEEGSTILHAKVLSSIIINYSCYILIGFRNLLQKLKQFLDQQRNLVLMARKSQSHMPNNESDTYRLKLVKCHSLIG